MKPITKEYVTIIMAIIAAAAMIGSALIWKNTEYENAWLYILSVYLIVQSIWEVYANRKKN